MPAKTFLVLDSAVGVWNSYFFPKRVARRSFISSDGRETVEERFQINVDNTRNVRTLEKNARVGLIT